jgi:hypothetical protein
LPCDVSPSFLSNYICEVRPYVSILGAMLMDQDR